MSDIDKMLADFESRKAAEGDAERSRRAAEDAQAAKTVRVYEASVLPVLREMADKLSAKYFAQVKERTSCGFLNPQLVLEFAPASPGDPACMLPSKLSFTQNKSGLIEVRKDVRGRGGSSQEAFAVNLSLDLDDISIARVTAQTKAFVAEVLNAS